MCIVATVRSKFLALSYFFDMAPRLFQIVENLPFQKMYGGICHLKWYRLTNFMDLAHGLIMSHVKEIWSELICHLFLVWNECKKIQVVLALLYPRPTIHLVRPSVCPSVCRRHGFRSISQVCFRISISNFICMLMVTIGGSLWIFSDVTFKMAAWRPY